METTCKDTIPALALAAARRTLGVIVPGAPVPRGGRAGPARFSLRLLATLIPVLLLAACGEDDAAPQEPSDGPPPPPLEIVSVSPAAGATRVETAATVAVVFNQDIDATTLTPETFRVRAGGVALPASLSYEAATRTALMVAPLLPGVSYEAEVTTGVRTPADSGLSAAQVWSFTTRTWQTVTVDGDGEVGRGTSLALDGTGRLHLSYFDSSNGDLDYATCSAGCDAAAGWRTTTVDADGIVGPTTRCR